MILITNILFRFFQKNNLLYKVIMVNLLKLSFVFFSVSLINAITINQVPEYINKTSAVSNITDDMNNTSVDYLNNSTNNFRKLLKSNPPAKLQGVSILVVKSPVMSNNPKNDHIPNRHSKDYHYEHHFSHNSKQTAKQTVDNFRTERSKTLSPAVKNILSNNEKKLDTWLATDLGKNAVKFCISLGILNKPSIYNGCLEDMMIIKDQKIAKESALSAEEVLSSDHPGTNRRFCQASGDPHCTNYDGSFFHIQEPGIYTIAKTDVFEVQEKMKKNGDNKVGVPSCMIGATVKVGSIIIEIDVANYKKVLVNGESVDIPENMAMNFGGVQVKYGKQTIEWKGEKAVATGMKVTAKNGFMAMIEGGYCGVLEVNVPISYYGKMQGICGNADGNKNADDFKDVNGKTMDVNYGGKSWEMSGYGGPTSPLSKWQLAWKPKGTSCYFAKDCEQYVITATPVVSTPIVASTNKPATAATPVVSTPTVSSTNKPATAATPVVSTPTVVVTTKPATVVSTPTVAATTKPATVVIPVVSAPTVASSTAKASVASSSTAKASVASSSTAKASVASSSTAKASVASSVSSSIKNDEKKIKQLFHDVKETHGFSKGKLQDLKKNILKMIGDENKSKEKELAEFQKTILFSEQDLKKLNKKYDDKVKEHVALNESITKLEKTMNEHYKQMLSDAKYLLLLDKIKPNFLQTLTAFNEQVRSIKDTIQVNIIEGDDKALMLRIMFEMNDKTTNYTSVLSNEFIKHYEKYKKKASFDKSEYDSEYSQIELLKTKYEAQKKLRDSYLIEYKNAMIVLDRMQKDYDMNGEDLKSFKQIAVFIENIFNNNYNKC